MCIVPTLIRGCLESEWSNQLWWYVTKNSSVSLIPQSEDFPESKKWLYETVTLVDFPLTSTEPSPLAWSASLPAVP